MFRPDQYELLDFGGGQKLERIGGVLVARPSPAAEQSQRHQPDLWKTAAVSFRRTGKEDGRWRGVRSLPSPWEARHGGFCLNLKPTPFGHVGLFPEQASNWDWLANRVRRAATPPKVLNLFAYTGGSTLACAAAGAEVVHVDAAKNVVRWARSNAEASELAEAPIRWIAEDALTLVRREMRRGNGYDAIILDPPSYGHGPKGEPWKLQQDLLPLLSACAQLTAGRLAFALLTCHTPGIDPADLEAYMAEAFFGHCQSGAQAASMYLTTTDGRRLPAGLAARWPAEGRSR